MLLSFRKTPKTKVVPLARAYSFMYENFVLLTQHDTYLLLEKRESQIFTLHFDSANCRYGYPNDEVGHPIEPDEPYALYEISNSPWVAEMLRTNRVHPHHQDWMFENKRHFIIRFKDVTFECVCTTVKEIVLTPGEATALVLDELSKLES